MNSKIKLILALFFLFAILSPRFFWHFLRPEIAIEPIEVKITIPEGYTLKDISEKFKRFKNFNKENFLASAKEGYLFPDTYFFDMSETEQEVIKKMEDNFEKKVGDIEPGIVIMASLLEKEAITKQDKKIISGILWKRIKANMPLQVDACFKYICDKTSEELTLDDLKIDSPYNTYANKGLPPASICNPGLESIEAAKNPTSSSYWYYLSDKNSVIYYAKDFDEHKRNKEKYLR